MQAQINKELAALMQLGSVEQAIKTLLSSGVAPGTVAAQKVQQTAALTQSAPQSQPMPPSGIERVLPGVGVQAAQSAQAAQPATQGDVNQLRQMMSQMAPQGQGISAGADVRMAEGGIVGYAGPDGSEVELDDTKLSVSERFRRDMRRLYERTGLSAKRAEYLQRTGATPEMVAQKLGSAAPAPAEAPEASYSNESRIGLASKPVPSAAPTAPATAPAPRPSGGERKQPAAETGIATLMGPAVPTGSERQFGEAMAAQGRIEIPQERTPQQIAAEREALYRARGIDPDFAKQRMSRIEAQERRDQEEAAARAASLKDRPMENLISRLVRAKGQGLGALGEAQRGMEPIIAAQRAGDERFAALMRERQMAADKERSAIEDMQRALADGDITRAEKSRNDALAARNAKNELEAKARAQYAPQLLQAETAALDRASREKESGANRATNVQIARIQAAARENPGGKEALAMARVQQAINGNPLLKSLAEQAKFDASAAARYRTEEEALYKRVAPELFGGAGAAPAAASNDPLGLRR